MTRKGKVIEMPFNLKNLNPATRFYWGAGEEEWVDLRLVTDEAQNKIRRECGIKLKSEYKTDKNGRPVRIEFMDSSDEMITRFNDLLNDFAIEDWHLSDNEGNPIPCTAENKKILIGGHPPFSFWVAEKLKELKEQATGLKKEELGNL